MKLIAPEDAFWCDKLSTDGTPLGRVPVKSEVVDGWRFGSSTLPSTGSMSIGVSTCKRSE